MFFNKKSHKAYDPTFNLYRFFKFFITKQKLGFATIFVCWLFWSLDQTLFPYILGSVVDEISQFKGNRNDIWHEIKTLLILGLCLWGSIEIAFRVAGFTTGHVHSKMMAQVRLFLFDRLFHQSHHFFAENMSGSMGRKVNDMAESMDVFLTKVLQLLLPTFVAILIAIGIFFTLSTHFAIILIVWLILHLSVCIWMSKGGEILSEHHSHARSEVMGKMIDALSNHSSIRLFGRSRFEVSYLRRYQDQEMSLNKKTVYFLEWRKVILGILTFLGPGVLMNWFSIYTWTKGNITTGDLVVIFNTTFNLTALVWWVGLELPNAFKELGVCRQALSLFQEKVDIVDMPAAEDLVVSSGKIEFRSVGFKHRGQENLFSNKSLIIEPRQHVGLVGLSGSGKSTFVNLILRLYDVQSGRILIDEQDVKEVTQLSLRENIAVIPQEPILFNRSVMENIRFARPTATDAEVIQAAKLAHAHEFIKQLPEKYQTSVGDKGSMLSGGQRQRIAIARAFLKNAPILVMDEATSALDSVTEGLIQESLGTLMQGKTTLIIAHRLATLKAVDRLLVFDKGKIVQDGKHAVLIKDEVGMYCRLWDAQMNGLITV